MSVVPRILGDLASKLLITLLDSGAETRRWLTSYIRLTYVGQYTQIDVQDTLFILRERGLVDYTLPKNPAHGLIWSLTFDGWVAALATEWGHS